MSYSQNNYWRAGFAFLLFLSILPLKKPLEWWILEIHDNEKWANLVAGSINRIILIIIFIFLIKKWKLVSFCGLNEPLRFRHSQAYLLPAIIFGGIIYGNADLYLTAEPVILTLFTVSVLLVGLAEELLFRGIILPLFIADRHHKKPALYFGLALSAMLFGMAHYYNLFREPDNFQGVTSQVIIATALGFFFGGLHLYTGNILGVASMHSLFNFSLGAGILKSVEPEAWTAQSSNAEDWSSFAISLVILIILIGSGLYMTWYSDEKQILKKLN